jgi:hypothetical protein
VPTSRSMSSGSRFGGKTVISAPALTWPGGRLRP